MADDKKKDDKKEEKPFVDPFSLMKTDDLLKHLETYHANTPDAAKKREGHEHEMMGYAQMFNDITNSYLIGKRGESSKIAKTPAKYSLDKKLMNVESAELLNTILLKAVEHEMGKDAAAIYKKNPNLLADYARGKGIDWHDVQRDLMDNYKNINKSEKYQKVKQHLSKLMVKDLTELNRVKSELYNNVAHHGAVKKKVVGALQKKGLTLEETVGVPDAIEHYSTLIQNNGLSEDYISANDTHIKKYEDPNAKKK